LRWSYFRKNLRVQEFKGSKVVSFGTTFELLNHRTITGMQDISIKLAELKGRRSGLKSYREQLVIKRDSDKNNIQQLTAAIWSLSIKDTMHFRGLCRNSNTRDYFRADKDVREKEIENVSAEIENLTKEIDELSGKISH